MTYDLTPEQRQFFNEYCQNKYDVNKYYRTYGRQSVDEWMTQDWFINMWKAFQSDQSQRDEYAIRQFNNFQFIALDNIANGLSGKFGDDHRVALSKWILSGPRNFLDALNKTKGEKEAEKSKSHREALRVVRDNGND